MATSAGERILTRYFGRAEKLEAARDEDVRMIEQIVFEIRDLAKSYWLESGRLQSIEGSMTGRIQFLSATIDEMYKGRLDSLRNLHVALNRFDGACTNGSFQTMDRLPEPNRCSDIELMAYNLVHAARSERRKL